MRIFFTDQCGNNAIMEAYCVGSEYDAKTDRCTVKAYTRMYSSVVAANVTRKEANEIVERLYRTGCCVKEADT